ncbi:MAG: hypothetical protein JRI50_04780 [Deltaproteobacteria bacterium]|nr:hypothetical protein [Deltaproteobacteria bacterium]
MPSPELRVGDALLEQLARFLPRGLGGIAYWDSLYLFHKWIYQGMVHALAQATGKPIVKGLEMMTGKKDKIFSCGILN